MTAAVTWLDAPLLFLQPHLAPGSRATVRTPGELWEREAERDVQAHGRPVTVGRPREYVSPFAAWQFVANRIECRRPAMRAARAELDALYGRGPAPRKDPS